MAVPKIAVLGAHRGRASRVWCQYEYGLADLVRAQGLVVYGICRQPLSGMIHNDAHLSLTLFFAWETSHLTHNTPTSGR